MVWLVDDLAGAAMGPWGLAVATGIGVGVLVSKKLAPAVTNAGSGAASGLVGAATGAATNAIGAATGAATGVVGAASGVATGAVVGARDQVRDRVASGLSGVRDWWSDVYAEAYAEWQQSHGASGTASAAPAATTGAAAAPGAPPAPAPVARAERVAGSTEIGSEPATDATPTLTVVRPATGRVRGPNGRYVKPDES